MIEWWQKGKERPFNPISSPPACSCGERHICGTSHAQTSSIRQIVSSCAVLHPVRPHVQQLQSKQYSNSLTTSVSHSFTSEMRKDDKVHTHSADGWIPVVIQDAGSPFTGSRCHGPIRYPPVTQDHSCTGCRSGRLIVPVKHSYQK
jgi:hypothetical protein